MKRAAKALAPSFSAIAVDPRAFEHEGLRGLLRRALGGNPADAIAIFVLVIAAGAILVNALYRQPGPHPAPIFSIKPRPVVSQPTGGVVPALPRAATPPHERLCFNSAAGNPCRSSATSSSTVFLPAAVAAIRSAVKDRRQTRVASGA